MTTPAECAFMTQRLRVAPWHTIAEEFRLDLDEVISGMLTRTTTLSLPNAWHGDFSSERATAWIEERDAESPTLLAVDSTSLRPVGLVILFAMPSDQGTTDVRIGYIINEADWGRGLATELVAGLTTWARSQGSVRSLSGGVAVGNTASIRVLTRNGFTRGAEESADTHSDAESLYWLDTQAP